MQEVGTQPSSNGAAGSASGSVAALLTPVGRVDVSTLPPQQHWSHAVSALAEAVACRTATLARELPGAAACSGVLRVEAPLARGPSGVSSALQWLAGQERLRGSRHAVYFSCRASTAPDTPATADAEAASRGWAAAAGLGAAWLWAGPGGTGFDAPVVAGLGRFLSEGAPRLRVLGGSRCARRSRLRSGGAMLQQSGGALPACMRTWHMPGPD